MKFKDKNKFEGAVAQVFTNISPVYEWDDEEDKPVQVGIQDDDEIIMSSADCGLSYLYDKYLPDDSKNVDYTQYFEDFKAKVGGKNVEFTDDVDVAQALDDFGYIQNVASQVDEMREAYGLPDTMSRAQVLETVAKIAQGAINGKSNKVSGGKSTVDSGNSKDSAISADTDDSNV